MRTDFRRRLGASLLTLIFALFWGESLVLAACPMHDRMAANAALPHGPHAHGGAAGSAHGEHAAHTPSKNAPQSESHGCQCLGSCNAGNQLTLPGQQLTVATARVYQVRVSRALPRVVTEYAGQTRLPFANAPPPEPRAA